MNGENLEKVETQLQVSRSQEGELNQDHELLTISEMQTRGFSEKLVVNIVEMFCDCSLSCANQILF